MTSKTHQIYNIIFEHGFDPPLPPRLNNVKKTAIFLQDDFPNSLEKKGVPANFYAFCISVRKKQEEELPFIPSGGMRT